MPITQWFGARRKSFAFALRGLARLAREPNFRIHLAALVLVVALGFWLALTPLEWACICLAVALVLATEALNTALESLADAVSPAHSPLIGVAKDVAAGAVLLSAIGSGTVGLVLFLPKFWIKLS
ncbi:MAG: diacylglycerol kinase family protein [Polyangiaceae bacterium]